MEWLERLAELLKCTLCHDIAVDPVELSCEHLFCRLCADKILPDLESRVMFKCPLCQRAFDRQRYSHMATLSEASKVIRSAVSKTIYGGALPSMPLTPLRYSPPLSPPKLSTASAKNCHTSPRRAKAQKPQGAGRDTSDQDVQFPKSSNHQHSLSVVDPIESSTMPPTKCLGSQRIENDDGLPRLASDNDAPSGGNCSSETELNATSSQHSSTSMPSDISDSKAGLALSPSELELNGEDAPNAAADSQSEDAGAQAIPHPCQQADHPERKITQAKARALRRALSSTFESISDGSNPHETTSDGSHSHTLDTFERSPENPRTLRLARALCPKDRPPALTIAEVKMFKPVAEKTLGHLHPFMRLTKDNEIRERLTRLGFSKDFVKGLPRDSNLLYTIYNDYICVFRAWASDSQKPWAKSGDPLLRMVANEIIKRLSAKNDLLRAQYDAQRQRVREARHIYDQLLADMLRRSIVSRDVVPAIRRLHAHALAQESEDVCDLSSSNT